MEQMLRRSGFRSLAAIAPNLPVVLNQVFNSAGNFIVTIVLVRLLGLAAFGHFTIYFLVSQSAVAVLAAAVTMPAVSIAASETVESRRGLLSAAGALLIAGVLAGVALAGVAQLVLTIAGIELQILLLPFAALFAMMALNDLARRLLLFERAFAAVWVLDILRYGAVAFALFWSAGRSGPDPVAFTMIALAAAYAVALAGFAATALSVWRAVRFAHFPAQAWRLLQTGKWLSASATLQLVHDNAFLFVGSAILGAEAVGIVRTAQTLVGIVHPIFLTLEHLLPRRVGQLVSQQGWVQALREYDREAMAIAVGLLLLLAGLAVFAQPLLHLMAGAEVASYAWVMQGLCLPWVPYLVYILVTYPLRAMERTRALAVSIMACVIVDVIIAVPAVEHFGIVGIVAGMLISNLVGVAAALGQYWFIRREFLR